MVDDGGKQKYSEKNQSQCHFVPLALHDNRPTTTTRAVIWPVSCSEEALMYLHFHGTLCKHILTWMKKTQTEQTEWGYRAFSARNIKQNVRHVV
jgi:hypothetical protein